MVTVLVLLLVLIRRIEILLEDEIELKHSQCALFHGSKHLNVRGGSVHIGGKLVSDKLYHMLVDDRRLAPLQEKEVLALIVDDRHFAIVNPVGIHDYIALFRLPEYLLEKDRRKSAAVYEVSQNLTGSHARKLGTVPHKDQVRSGNKGLKKGVKEMNIHHGHLIDYYGIGLKGIVPVLFKMNS